MLLCVLQVGGTIIGEQSDAMTKHGVSYIVLNGTMILKRASELKLGQVEGVFQRSRQHQPLGQGHRRIDLVRPQVLDKPVLPGPIGLGLAHTPQRGWEDGPAQGGLCSSTVCE